MSSNSKTLIATFNVNSIRSRAPIIKKWLKENKPAILALQETKCSDEDFPLDEFASTGYELTYGGQKRYNGIAVFSAKPITNVVYGFNSDPADKPRLCRLQTTPPNSDKQIWIVNTYVPQGREPQSEHFQYKLNWLERLLEYFNKNFKPSDDILWLGDINIAMDERDLHDPENLWGSVCYCQEVIDRLKDIMQWGFSDLFRKFNPDPGIYSFWDYRVPNGFKRNIGWRLDYIMATKSMTKKATKAYIDKAPRSLKKPSDHTPLVCEFIL
jgi:exodeoxyribonuclease-3